MMRAPETAALVAEIRAMCREMKLPSVARDVGAATEEARKGGEDALLVVHRLLATEHADRAVRRTARRAKEAYFPVLKTLQGFDFMRNPTLDAALIQGLSTCSFVTEGRPVLLLGGTGTGKTHLAVALGLSACERGHSVRFTTAAALVNELVEAQDSRELSRVVARYARFDLLVLDELGYLPLTEAASQLLFQVIAERGERRSTIVTTNLPFTEWGALIPEPRLARAFIERLTFRAHIVDTGDRSIRVEEMNAARRRKGVATA